MIRDEILNAIKKHLPEIMAYGIEKIGIFGSITRADTVSPNDIDILISFAPGKKTFDNYMDAKFLLQDILKSECIDLVIEESLKSRIKPYIYKDLIYAS